MLKALEFCLADFFFRIRPDEVRPLCSIVSESILEGGDTAVLFWLLIGDRLTLRTISAMVEAFRFQDKEPWWENLWCYRTVSERQKGGFRRSTS